MADRYWSASLGDDKVGVAEAATSTAGDHVEVRITYDTAGMNKSAALRCLEFIRQRIIEDTWPPV